MLLDIGAGILIALFVGKICALSVNVWLIGAGVLFSLLADADAVVNLIRFRGTIRSYRHRDLFHYPLIYMPVGMILAYLVGAHFGGPYGPALSLLFGLCSLAHFIHDSIGLGWGVAWLWPFKTDRYSFFYQYDVWPSGVRPRRGIYVWKEEKIDELEYTFGDKDWFRHIYLRPHPYGLVEWAVLVAGIIALWAAIR